MSQREHGDKRRVSGFVAKVILEDTAGELGAGGRLGRNDAEILPFFQLVAQEGEGDAREVRTATEAGDNHIGIFSGHFHLLFGFESDDRLMQHHMVEHTAQRIFAVGRLHGQFHGFGDGGSQTALVVGVLGEDFTAGTGTHTGRCDDLGTECLHDGAAIGFLVVAHFYHIHGQFETESLGGKGECGTPLAGTGLGGDIGYALFFAEIGLCNGRVEFVGTYRADTFVFEIDVGRGVEIFFEAVGSYQGGRSPYLIHVTHLFGYLYPGIGLVHLLVCQFFGEERIEIFLFHRLMGLRIQGGQGFRLHVGDDVIPCRGNVFFLQ